jgi:hypothetical protein
MASKIRFDAFETAFSVVALSSFWPNIVLVKVKERAENQDFGKGTEHIGRIMTKWQAENGECVKGAELIKSTISLYSTIVQ